MPSTILPKAPSVYSDPKHPYWTAPRDIWLATGAPWAAPYPCLCLGEKGRPCDPRWCPCYGRVDPIDHVPARCCARLAAQTRTGDRS